MARWTPSLDDIRRVERAMEGVPGPWIATYGEITQDEYLRLRQKMDDGLIQNFRTQYEGSVR